MQHANQCTANPVCLVNLRFFGTSRFGTRCVRKSRRGSSRTMLNGSVPSSSSPKIPTKSSLMSDPRSLTHFSKIFFGGSFPTDDEPSSTNISPPSGVDKFSLMIPGAFIETRPPSPALSDSYSLLSPPTGDDEEALRQTCELYESMRQTPNFDEVPTCSPFANHRSPSKSRQRMRKFWNVVKSPESSMRRRKGKQKALVDEYGNLLPLDGEEGELIDDEACYVEAVYSVSGMGERAFLHMQLRYSMLFRHSRVSTH